jgi:serine protease AprX
MKRLAFVLALIAAAPAATAAGDRQTVLVWMKNQPAEQVAGEVRGRYAPAIEELSAPLREIYAAHAGDPTRFNYVERLAADDLSRRLRECRLALRSEVGQRLAAATQPDFDAVAARVTRAGGRVVYRYLLRNGMAIQAPASVIADIRRDPLVAEVARPILLRPCLDKSMITIGADAFWNAGYLGGNVRVAVVDTGIDVTHPGLLAHVWIQGVFHYAAEGYPGYADNPNTPDDLQGHGTRCGGVLFCSYPPYLGALQGSDYAVNAKAGFLTDGGGGSMLDTDMYAAVEWAALTVGVDAISYSFGGAADQDYDTFAGYWDSVVSTLGIEVATAVGNSGPGGWPLTPSIGYNVMCVGGTTDQGTVDRSDDVVWSGSTTGPTHGGRKKPDIVVPCDTIKTTKNTWESGSWWSQSAATSWAAPHIAGASGLLTQAGVSDPMAQKAILINTSEDRSTVGWNEDWGWGYTDLRQALAHLDDCFAGAVTAKGTPGGGRFYRGTVQPGDRLTLAWRKRADWRVGGPPMYSYKLTDLDLYTYEETSNTQLDASTSDIDNVEQVNPQAGGEVVAGVWCDSTTIQGASEETFALATPSGFAEVAAGFDVTGTDVDLEIGNILELTSTVTNSGDLILHNARVGLELPAGLALLAGDATQQLGTLAPGNSAAGHWRVRVDADGLLVGVIRAQSDSYGGMVVGLGDLTVHATRIASAPAGWINAGWNWISVPLLPDNPGAGAILGTENVTNKLFRWDPVRRTVELCPDDFTDIELGGGYILWSLIDQAPSFAGTAVTGVYEIAVPGPGWFFPGQPMNHTTLLSALSIRNNTLGQTRTAIEDRNAADPWINWNWVFWDSHLETAKLVSFSAGDDDRLRPWYGYLLWSRTSNLTLLVPSG